MPYDSMAPWVALAAEVPLLLALFKLYGPPPPLTGSDTWALGIGAETPHPGGMNHTFRVGKLTQALVAANMSGSADPYQMAAKTIREAVRVALRALPAWDPAANLVVEEAVRGGLQALIQADLDVARGGVLTLCEVGELAQDLGRDPTETLMSALRGMASIHRLMPSGQLDRLRRAIEASYLGAGDAFAGLLQAGPDAGLVSRPLSA